LNLDLNVNLNATLDVVLDGLPALGTRPRPGQR